MPPRIVGLIWDEWNEQHIARHGVEIYEVEEAIENIIYTNRSRDYLRVLAQTYGGRYLTIIIDHEGQGYWYTVTARDMTHSERRLLRRRLR